MNTISSGTSDKKDVDTVVDTKSGKAVWVKIGAAFTNKDGSINVRLDALPVNGTLQVREPRVWEDRRPDGASAPLPLRTSEAFA